VRRLVLRLRRMILTSVPRAAEAIRFNERNAPEYRNRGHRDVDD
jgi:hypothetical protein